MKKSRKKGKSGNSRVMQYYFIIAIFIIIYSLTYIFPKKNPVSIKGSFKKEFRISDKTCEEVETPPEEFSQDSLIDYLKSINIRFPEVVLSQAILESGHFKSNVFLTNNNMFGMKKSYTRPSSSLKDSLGYAYFDNWKLSVLDYALYQSYFLSKYKTKEEYLERIGKSYAEDKSYIIKIKQIMRGIEKNFY